jgi:hypothetical protein
MTVDEKARLWIETWLRDSMPDKYKEAYLKDVRKLPPFTGEERDGVTVAFKNPRLPRGYDYEIDLRRLIGALTRLADGKIAAFLRLLEEYDIPKDGTPWFTPKEGKYARIVSCGYKDGKWVVIEDPAA